MQTVIYNTSGEIIGLGNPDAATQFLLPTPPMLESSEISIEHIVDLNGNHWRKIFVIISKLCCGKKTWQSYREHDLLTDIYLNFSPKPSFDKVLNVVCGKSHAKTVGINDCKLLSTPVDTTARVREFHSEPNHRTLLTPYLDYRQFPNALIEEVVSTL